MRVSYQHANPYYGNESYLMRFHDGIHDQTACVLIDAGDGVAVGDLLAEDEYLTAVLLTHAHLDHYRTLAANVRDGAPVYAAPDTAAILDTVLSEGKHNYDLGDVEPVTDALEPVEDWTPLTGELDICPVPAGHAPGAAGFLVRFEDNEPHHLLATGDFTRRRVGGYPGFTTGLGVDVEAVFLTAAESAGYERELTESVGTMLERAREGSSVLVTASGLTGVQYAYLLGHLGEELDESIPINIVGQVAKLYADLEYDVPGVEACAVFEDPEEVLAPETVTIAGPEVPVEGSAHRLFEEIEDDPAATLVQITAGATTPRDSAGCTVYDYTLINHPTEDEIDGVVEAFGPIEVVIEHGRNNSGKYKDKYSSFVWATDDSKEYTLYDDGRWLSPEWVGPETDRRIRARNGRSNGWTRGGAFGDDRSLPALERADDVDFVAEGLDMDSLLVRLRADHGSETVHAEGERESVTVGTQKPDETSGEADETTTELHGADVATIVERLDAIEATLTADTVRARVVDAGDGVTLLRLLEDVALQHGQEVELTIESEIQTNGTGDSSSE
ncbi:MAG TPA: MBL fold metallo-hydrolase [Halococcus sp.]|nr:MBL fold metallo-hydrolase [Halococcus sp.]